MLITKTCLDLIAAENQKYQKLIWTHPKTSFKEINQEHKRKMHELNEQYKIGVEYENWLAEKAKSAYDLRCPAPFTFTEKEIRLAIGSIYYNFLIETELLKKVRGTKNYRAVWR